MPANEFEKQVQQQLEQFQLNPSASVWKKVEENIREKKRRRVAFYILLPVALALLGFSLYDFLYGNKKTETARQTAVVNKNNSPVSSPAEIPGETPVQHPLSEEQTIAITPDGAQKNDTKEILSEVKTVKGKKAVTIQKTDAAFVITNTSIGKTGKDNGVKNDNDADGLQKGTDNSLTIVNNTPAKQKRTEPGNSPLVVTDAGEVKDQPVVADKKQDAISMINQRDIPIVKKDSNQAAAIAEQDSQPETVVKKKQSGSKIKWGIDFSAGLAFNNKGTLNFAAAQAFDMNYSGNGAAAGGGPPAVIIPPSPVKQGPAFRIGMVAEWELSKRSSFSAGLQYAYSSNRMKVGAARDTSVTLQPNSNASSSIVEVDKLYRGAQQNKYTNNYHFIQLPLQYHWKISKSARLPIQLNTGITAGYLAATNALVYSAALGGVYYKDKNAYNKVHLNLTAGVSFCFHTKNNSGWTIGPDFSFDMSRLVKNDNKQYLMFGGINAKLFFPKRKNK